MTVGADDPLDGGVTTNVGVATAERPVEAAAIEPGAVVVVVALVSTAFGTEAVLVIGRAVGARGTVACGVRNPDLPGAPTLIVAGAEIVDGDPAEICGPVWLFGAGLVTCVVDAGCGAVAGAVVVVVVVVVGAVGAAAAEDDVVLPEDVAVDDGPGFAPAPDGEVVDDPDVELDGELAGELVGGPDEGAVDDEVGGGEGVLAVPDALPDGVVLAGPACAAGAELTEPGEDGPVAATLLEPNLSVDEDRSVEAFGCLVAVGAGAAGTGATAAGVGAGTISVTNGAAASACASAWTAGPLGYELGEPTWTGSSE